MTMPTVAVQATQEYREPATTPADDRVRVALVPGSGSVASDDLYPILRRRLLTLSWLMTGIFVLTLIVGAVISHILPPSEFSDPVDGPLEWLIRRWRLMLTLLTSFLSAMILWRWPPRTIGALRLIEFVVIGSIVIVNLNISVSGAYGRLEAAAQESQQVRMMTFSNYTNAGGLIWCLILTSYGAIIPNTWRRCAVVVGLIAASPLPLFAINAFWLRPLDPSLALFVLIVLATTNSMAAAIAIFASSRIEYSRRQAAEARKLGQYVLKEKLGAGGMGEVYRAEHVLLRRPCALKLIRAERAGDPKNLRRFEREVQVTATLTHPNTIQIYDYGHAADGTFYYVMEYLPGLTLDELVEREGPLPPARAIHLLRQVCGALKEAHGRGLIHRDIKPGNVMICERGGIHDVAKLLDFGLVLPPVSDADDKLTKDGAITGTPAYLSPEQAGGQEQLDARSDIYSVGALAYFLLAGHPPFPGLTGVKMLAAHLYENPAPLTAVRADIPPDFEAIVQRCLAKKPHERFPNAESLDAALAACGSNGKWSVVEAANWWNGRHESERPPSTIAVDIGKPVSPSSL
jgi:serine/threonine-protein kinase